MRDALSFLRGVVRSPQGVGAIMPSSQALARCMVEACGIGPDDVVVELGAGTGPVTRFLVEAHPDVPLLVLEPDSGLAARCRDHAPSADVVEAYAQDVGALLTERGLGPATRIVSSLPFAGWPAELQDAVFSGILDASAPDARMVTFTYVSSLALPAGRRTRQILEERFATVGTTPVVWCNVPPAFVYVCERAAVGQSAPTR